MRKKGPRLTAHSVPPRPLLHNRLRATATPSTEEAKGPVLATIEKTVVGVGRMLQTLLRTLAAGTLALFKRDPIAHFRRLVMATKPLAPAPVVVLFAGIASQCIENAGDAFGRAASLLPSYLAPQRVGELVDLSDNLPLKNALEVVLIGSALLWLVSLVTQRRSDADRRAWAAWTAAAFAFGQLTISVTLKLPPARDAAGELPLIVRAYFVGVLMSAALPVALLAARGAAPRLTRFQVARVIWVRCVLVGLLGMLVAMAAGFAQVAMMAGTEHVLWLADRALPEKPADRPWTKAGSFCIDSEQAGVVRCQIALLYSGKDSTVVWLSPWVRSYVGADQDDAGKVSERQVVRVESTQPSQWPMVVRSKDVLLLTVTFVPNTRGCKATPQLADSDVPKLDVTVPDPEYRHVLDIALEKRVLWDVCRQLKLPTPQSMWP